MSTTTTTNSAESEKQKFLAFNALKNAKAPRGVYPAKIRAVINYLEIGNDKHYITQSTLAEHLGCAGGTVYNIMNQMVSDGIVRVDESVKPFRYYRLK